MEISFKDEDKYLEYAYNCEKQCSIEYVMGYVNKFNNSTVSEKESLLIDKYKLLRDELYLVKIDLEEMGVKIDEV